MEDRPLARLVNPSLTSKSGSVHVVVRRPDGLFRLLTIKDRRREALMIIPKSPGILAPPDMAGLFLKKEFRFSLHPSPSDPDNIRITHNFRTDGITRSGRATVKAQPESFVFPIYTERFPGRSSDGPYDLKRQADRLVEVDEYDPRENVLIYTVFALGKGVPHRRDFRNYNLLRIEFTDYDVGILWSYLHCPSISQGGFSVIADPSVMINSVISPNIFECEYSSCLFTEEDTVTVMAFSVAMQSGYYVDSVNAAEQRIGRWPLHCSREEWWKRFTDMHLTPRIAPDHGLKVGRNESCPCGSQRRYKNCHGSNMVI